MKNQIEGQVISLQTKVYYNVKKDILNKKIIKKHGYSKDHLINKNLFILTLNKEEILTIVFEKNIIYNIDMLKEHRNKGWGSFAFFCVENLLFNSYDRIFIQNVLNERFFQKHGYTLYKNGDPPMYVKYKIYI